MYSHADKWRAEKRISIWMLSFKRRGIERNDWTVPESNRNQECEGDLLFAAAVAVYVKQHPDGARECQRKKARRRIGWDIRCFLYG